MAGDGKARSFLSLPTHLIIYKGRMTGWYGEHLPGQQSLYTTFNCPVSDVKSLSRKMTEGKEKGTC